MKTHNADAGRGCTAVPRWQGVWGIWGMPQVVQCSYNGDEQTTQSWEPAQVKSLGAESVECYSSPAVHPTGLATPAAVLQAINESKQEAAEKQRDAQALQKEIDRLNAEKRQAEAERANIVVQCVWQLFLLCGSSCSLAVCWCCFACALCQQVGLGEKGIAACCLVCCSCGAL